MNNHRSTLILCREWQEKLRQAGNEGLLSKRRTEEELRQLQRKEENVRKMTLKKAKEQAEAAKSPPRDDSALRGDSAPRADPAPRVPSSTAETGDKPMLTIGVDPEEDRALLDSTVGSPTNMNIDDTVLDG